jgi:hypothetical protein
MNGTIDAATAQQRCIGSIYYGVYVQLRDIAAHRPNYFVFHTLLLIPHSLATSAATRGLS